MEIIHFFKPNSRGVTILLIYVDDMIVSSNNVEGVTSLTQQLATIFEIKILGNLQYFLGIEVACSHQDIFLSHLVVNGTLLYYCMGSRQRRRPHLHIFSQIKEYD